MRLFLSYLPALACAGSMFICMHGMRLGGGKDRNQADVEDQIAELRAELDRLRSEPGEGVESDKSIGSRP